MEALDRQPRGGSITKKYRFQSKRGLKLDLGLCGCFSVIKSVYVCVCVCVSVKKKKRRGSAGSLKKITALKWKDGDSLFSISKSGYLPLSVRLCGYSDFLLEGNPTWIKNLTSRSFPKRAPNAQLFCSLLHTQAHTCRYACKHLNYLPRCTFLLRERLLCAAIHISSENTLLILPGSIASFLFLDLSITPSLSYTHILLHTKSI